jgi:hypothetical protein
MSGLETWWLRDTLSFISINEQLDQSVYLEAQSYRITAQRRSTTVGRALYRF